jgi:hypothetical protein
LNTGWLRRCSSPETLPNLYLYAGWTDDLKIELVGWTMHITVDFQVRIVLCSPVDPMLQTLYTPVERLKSLSCGWHLVTPVKPMGIDPLNVGLTGEPKNPLSAHFSMISPMNL